MPIQWVLFGGILMLNTTAALMLALLVSRRRTAPGSSQAAWMFLSLALWTFAYAMITFSRNLEAKLLWLKIENLGILGTPVLWLLFVIYYTRNDHKLPRLIRYSFWLIPVVSWVLLFSGVWFRYYYAAVEPYSSNGGPLIIAERGPWYSVQLIASYAFLAIGFVMLLWHMLRLRGLYRRQLYFFLGGVVVPILVNIFYQSGTELYALAVPFDLTPISLTITAGLTSIGIFGLRMFDLIPIARHVVVENIPEMVIVVDAYNRVLDLNRTAEEWLRRPAHEILGEDVMKIFSLWSGLAGRFKGGSEIREEIEVAGNPPRTLELLIAPLFGAYGNLEGRTIVARDITSRKTMENELLRTNQALKARISEVDALRARLQEQIIRDPLTGLYNRRHLSAALDEEVLRAQKNNVPLAVVVIDLDHFKKFNDTYGHKCGDAVLLSFGKLLSSKLRPGEIACRYGGEEFVVAMPGITLETAIERAEDWRQSMETKTFEYNGQALFHATMSVGIAVLPLHGQDSEALLQAADQALYQSKANGRNRVTIYQSASQPDQKKSRKKKA